jgi:hypothetical protein
VRHVSVLCDDHESLDRVLVADDVLELERTVLLDPVEAKVDRGSGCDRSEQTGRRKGTDHGISYDVAEAATLPNAPSFGFEDDATAAMVFGG